MAILPAEFNFDPVDQPPKAQRVIFDCAIGESLDDALALGFLLRSPILQLAAVTCVQGDLAARGGVAWEIVESTDEWLNLVPVLGGCRGSLATLSADGIDGRRFTYGPHAGQLVYGRVGATPDTGLEVLAFGVAHTTIIATGPLTNVATALALEPELALGRGLIAAIGQLVKSDEPERNVRDDVEAAFLVLKSDLPARLIPRDLVNELNLEEEDFRALSRCPNGGGLVQILLQYRRQVAKHGGSRNSRLRSLLTVVAAERPHWFEWTRGTMNVHLIHGDGYGHAVFEPGADGRHFVATSFDRDKVRNHILDRLGAGKAVAGSP